MSRLGTIVMGTVVAGLFSLALWDTLRDRTAPPPTCEQQHPELAMIRELNDAKQAKLSLLTGTAIASPGRYLEGVSIEMPLDREIADRLPTITRPTAAKPYQVTFTEEAGIVRVVEVVVGRFDPTYGGTCDPSDDPCSCSFAGDDRQLCEELERRLHAAWGPSTSEDGETRVWIDRETRARAQLGSCVLTFDRAP
jgi:hypothetical protein